MYITSLQRCVAANLQRSHFASRLLDVGQSRCHRLLGRTANHRKPRDRPWKTERPLRMDSASRTLLNGSVLSGWMEWSVQLATGITTFTSSNHYEPKLQCFGCWNVFGFQQKCAQNLGAHCFRYDMLAWPKPTRRRWETSCVEQTNNLQHAPSSFPPRSTPRSVSSSLSSVVVFRLVYASHPSITIIPNLHTSTSTLGVLVIRSMAQNVSV